MCVTLVNSRLLTIQLALVRYSVVAETECTLCEISGEQFDGTDYLRGELCRRVLRTPSHNRSPQDCAILAEELTKHAFLAQLPSNKLYMLCKVSALEEVGEGHVIMQEGDIGDSFYVVFHGTANVFQIKASIADTHTNPDGSVLNLLEAENGKCVFEAKVGNAFGEAALQSGAPRNATIIAMTPSELIRVDKTHYDRILMDMHEVLNFKPAALFNEIKKVLEEGQPEEAREFIDASCRKFHPFSSMDDDIRSHFVSLMKIRLHTAGEVVYEKGQIPGSVGILLSGQIQLVNDSGRNLFNVTTGEMFGHHAVILKGTRTENAVSKKDSIVLTLRVADYEQVWKGRHDAAMQFLLSFLQGHSGLKRMTRPDLVSCYFGSSVARFKRQSVFPHQNLESILIIMRGECELRLGNRVVALVGPSYCFGNIRVTETFGNGISLSDLSLRCTCNVEILSFAQKLIPKYVLADLTQQTNSHVSWSLERSFNTKDRVRGFEQGTGGGQMLESNDHKATRGEPDGGSTPLEPAPRMSSLDGMPIEGVTQFTRPMTSTPAPTTGRSRQPFSANGKGSRPSTAKSAGTITATQSSHVSSRRPKPPVSYRPSSTARLQRELKSSPLGRAVLMPPRYL